MHLKNSPTECIAWQLGDPWTRELSWLALLKQSSPRRLAKLGTQGLVAGPSGFITDQRRRIVDLAFERNWPVVGPSSFADPRALVSFGASRLRPTFCLCLPHYSGLSRKRLVLCLNPAVLTPSPVRRVQARGDDPLNALVGANHQQVRISAGNFIVERPVPEAPSPPEVGRS